MTGWLEEGGGFGGEGGVDFGGADVIELGEGVEVGGNIFVHAAIQEVAEDFHRLGAVDAGEGDEVHLEGTAAVEEGVKGVEFVGEVGVALGVGEDGLFTGHSEVEDGMLEVGTFEHIGHLDEDGVVFVSEELGVFGPVIKAVENHVFSSQGGLDGQVFWNLGEEFGVTLTDQFFIGVPVNIGVHVGREHDFLDAHGLQAPEGFYGILDSRKTIIYSGKNVGMNVCSGDRQAGLLLGA